MHNATVTVFEDTLPVRATVERFSLESRLLQKIQIEHPTYTEVEFYCCVDCDNVVGRTTYILSDGSDENFVAVEFFFTVIE